MKSEKPKIVVICGPTGIGKTGLAVEIAQRLGAEIVGADSMQVYRLMEIGTAKPTPAEKALAAHHMIDVVWPDEPYDAARYAEDARRVIDGLYQKGVFPLVVGGTGLYIKALTQGLFKGKSTGVEVRERLRCEADLHGIQYLHTRLQKCDPQSAQRLHPNDRQRIIRALETFKTTNRTISEHQQEHAFRERPFEVLKIGLVLDRKLLYERINRRVEAMIEAGFQAEVEGLLASGYAPGLKSMQSIGYRHMIDFLAGRLSWEETVRTLKRDTRRYAKRQLTWFNADPEIFWFSPDEIGVVQERISDFMINA